MAVDVANVSLQTFKSVKENGEAGELVCIMPFPSQPVMFWGKGGSNKYRDSYFDRFGIRVWNQGDFVQRNPQTGGWLMLGRS